jgi:hypothetical protein
VAVRAFVYGSPRDLRRGSLWGRRWRMEERGELVRRAGEGGMRTRQTWGPAPGGSARRSTRGRRRGDRGLVHVAEGGRKAPSSAWSRWPSWQSSSSGETSMVSTRALRACCPSRNSTCSGLPASLVGRQQGVQASPFGLRPFHSHSHSRLPCASHHLHVENVLHLKFLIFAPRPG